MKRIVTFGEIMLRLTVQDGYRFTQAGGFDLAFGGSEANVAGALSNYGMEAAFVTRLPENDLAKAAINTLRAIGVDTSQIARGGDRMGIYFMEKGAACRKHGILYDRADSAIATAPADTFDWDRLLEGADWFHFSAITPALSEACAQMCLAACKAARQKGITVSCDLNYREQLWSSEEAGRVMSEICSFVDVCFAYEDEPAAIFGITPDSEDRAEGHKNMARKLADRFGFRTVAITSSDIFSADRLSWSAMLMQDGAFYFSRRYELTAADRIGGGDAFCGGFIYAALAELPPQERIEFAVASGSLKYSVQGDIACATADEVKRLAGIA